MYRCETCYKLYQTEAAFGEACSECESNKNSCRLLYVVLGCGDAMFRVADFPFSGNRVWAKSHFAGVSDGASNLAYRYFPVDGGELFRIEEQADGLRLLSCTPETANHIRVNGTPLPGGGSALKHGSSIDVYSVKRSATVMTLTVEFVTFANAN